MYGKIFDEIFDSTIAEFGGDTIYTFIVMVVKSDSKGFIRMTSAALSRTMGKDVDTIKLCLSNLEEPDPDSSTPEYNGRRIISLRELTGGEENRGWWVVNKEKYAKLAKQADRTNQNREAQQRKRDRTRQHSSAVVSGSQHSSAVNVYKDKDKDKDKDIYPDSIDPKNKEFFRFLESYPQKSGVINANKVWHSNDLDSLCDVLIADVNNRLTNCGRWQDKLFIPSVNSYLSEQRWKDDIVKIKKKYLTIKPDGTGGHESFTNWREYGEIHNIPRINDESISEYIVRLKTHRNSVSFGTTLK